MSTWKKDIINDLDALEWVPTLYSCIETAWSVEDECYISRWAPGDGLLQWVHADGESREDAVRELIEMAPMIFMHLHRDVDDWQQKYWKIKHKEAPE